MSSTAVRRFRRSAIVLAVSFTAVSAPAAPGSTGTVAVKGYKVDLGSPRQVKRVKVVSRARSTGRYRVQTSLDGKRYSTAGRLRPRRGRAAKLRLSRRARFVRLAGRARKAPRLIVSTARRRNAGGDTPAAPDTVFLRNQQLNHAQTQKECLNKEFTS